MKRENHPNFNKTHSEQTKDKMSRAKGTTIYVYSLDHQLINTFSSAAKAGESLKSSHKTILKYARYRPVSESKYIFSLEVLNPSSK